MDDRLYRSRSERMLAGVAGGLAEHFDLDPSLVRIIWVILALASVGTFVVIYVVMAIVVPEEPAGSGGWSTGSWSSTAWSSSSSAAWPTSSTPTGSPSGSPAQPADPAGPADGPADGAAGLPATPPTTPPDPGGPPTPGFGAPGFAGAGFADPTGPGIDQAGPTGQPAPPPLTGREARRAARDARRAARRAAYGSGPGRSRSGFRRDHRRHLPGRPGRLLPRPRDRPAVRRRPRSPLAAGPRPPRNRDRRSVVPPDPRRSATLTFGASPVASGPG